MKLIIFKNMDLKFIRDYLGSSILEYHIFQILLESDGHS